MTAFTVWLSLVFCSTRNPTGVLLFSVLAGEAQQSVSMLILGGYKGSRLSVTRLNYHESKLWRKG